MPPTALIETASLPYRAAGRFAWHFALGKLRHDPFFGHILEHGLIPDGARVLDLGSGQGLLAAWLIAAHAWHRDGGETAWPARWPPPPVPLSIHGIELTSRDVDRARIALKAHEARIRFVCDDIRTAPFPQSDVIVACDVLHYIDAAAQASILRRVHASLAADGVLLLRVSDADAGWRASLDRAVDFGVQIARSGRAKGLTVRSEAQWLALLGDLRFQVTVRPMGSGAHSANRLLIAHPLK
ncbi:tRNA (cmo5U34)-methyltransferase [Caballeronia pedi]|uniref:tRNA (Cmo5U34)-methyltransferase n=1 Tax=Caballeronia pedi TaxID=1777141 RepID=A0A157ZSF5_9BURK|nr:class I SAM-dependent methyltransferase [Caballeronia pedi]SAK47877.1 tRNA (cmo5U34)-methyltransferase [Caballeronia pedi]